MRSLTGLQLSLALLGMTLQVLIAGLILFKRLTRRWPSLLTSSLLSWASGVLLLYFTADRQHFTEYFYTYWISSALVSVTRLWLAVDLARSFEFVDYIPRWAYTATACLALTMATAAAWASWSEYPAAHELKVFVLLFNRSVCYAWAAFFVILLVCVRFTGVSWSTIGRLILTGSVLQVAADLLVAELLVQRSPALTAAAGYVDAFAGLSALSLWAFALTLPWRKLQQNRVA